ncbi:MAG: SCO family protein [Firmicutes bacterium]|nr:SCO family protein [Bacillota bacterium]
MLVRGFQSLVGAIVLSALAVAGLAQQPADPHAHHRQASPPSAEAGAESLSGMKIPDLVVVDQEGRERRFYSELIKDRVVAVNFIFTTCTTICPPLGATFARLQQLLGDRVGREVHLLSISVDPVVDTPPRLKAWGARFGAGPGWTFVTGKKSNVDQLLRALGLPVGPKEEHPPLVLIGNEAAGHWTRAFGFSSANRLLELIEAAAAAPHRSATLHSGHH